MLRSRCGVGSGVKWSWPIWCTIKRLKRMCKRFRLLRFPVFELQLSHAFAHPNTQLCMHACIFYLHLAKDDLQLNFQQIQVECKAMLEELIFQLPKLAVCYRENPTIVALQQVPTHPLPQPCSMLTETEFSKICKQVNAYEYQHVFIRHMQSTRSDPAAPSPPLSQPFVRQLSLCPLSSIRKDSSRCRILSSGKEIVKFKLIL